MPMPVLLNITQQMQTSVGKPEQVNVYNMGVYTAALNRFETALKPV